MQRKRRRPALALAWVIAFTISPDGHARVQGDEDLTSFSLEELSRLKISSVAKKPQSLATAAASVFVIRNEDIRRLGATTLPDALRLAPNLQVARTDANSWAISARGFNSTTANKLLVLIDGRPVYTPLYSGVFWDVQDVYMPDVERIEVISGPNAATWGSNAVNGVINVVTRSAHASTGTQVSLLGGNQLRRYQGRHGAARNEEIAYRAYAKHVVEGDTHTVDGMSQQDTLRRTQAGFRMDFERSRETLSFQGDVYDGGFGQLLVADAEFAGTNLLFNWNRDTDERMHLDMTFFYDRTDRLLPETIDETLQTIGAELRHHIDWSATHNLLWGIELRHARDEVTNFDALAFRPTERNMTWVSLFARDDVHFSDTFNMMFGLRLEHNSFTGMEFMPDLRLAWTPAENHTFWTSLSRAVRTPSRIDTEFTIPAQPPFAIFTNSSFRSEVANVLEIGYRGQTGTDVYYSVTAFHHDFSHLRSLEIQPDGSILLANLLEGTSSGMEGWLSYDVTEVWRLSGGMTYLDRNLELRPESTAIAITSEGNDPEYQWQLRSSFDISPHQELDLFVRHVGELPNPAIPAYTLLDLNWSWRTERGLYLSLHARNLLDKEHIEFGNPPNRSVIGRSIYANLTWSFQ